MPDLSALGERLAPCPFCGGDATHHDIGNAHTKSRGTEIWCTACYFSKTVKAIRQDLDWTRNHAIAAWNRRTPDLTQVAREARAAALEEAAANCEARRSAELIMRDNARRADNYDGATMHGDRAQVLAEQTAAIRALKDANGPRPEGEEG